MYGKRESEPVERAPTTPSQNSEAQSIDTEKKIYSYVTLKNDELPPLRYFTIKIYGRTLAALVDSGSNRTLINHEGIKIIKDQGLAMIQNRGTQIRTAKENVTEARHDYQPPPNTTPRRPYASTAEAYNLMRKWNLHFLGKRGNDAEAFLLQILKRREQ